MFKVIPSPFFLRSLVPHFPFQYKYKYLNYKLYWTYLLWKQVWGSCWCCRAVKTKWNFSKLPLFAFFVLAPVWVKFLSSSFLNLKNFLFFFSKQSIHNFLVFSAWSDGSFSCFYQADESQNCECKPETHSNCVKLVKFFKERKLGGRGGGKGRERK